VFGSDRSAEECRKLCKAQEVPHKAIGEAYEKVCAAIVGDTLSEYDGFEILGHLNDAAHAMRVASIKAKLELARGEKTSTTPIYDTVEVPEPAKPEPQPEPPKAKAAPPPKPEPPADDGLPPNDPAIDEGDVEVTEETPEAPPAVKQKPAKTPGAVEQLVADIRTELARFKDWGDYAAIFFDNKATDVDVLAGKVTDVRILSAILTALKAKPTGKAK
jgi:hypothetical protein